MRKYLIGILIGAAFSISATTYAADITSLIGKAVQGVFPVTVDGDVLPKTAIVIDGTSYLPVRAIGDAIGYDVSFTADLGIELKKKEVAPMIDATPLTTTEAAPSPSPTPDISVELKRLDDEIALYNKNIGNQEYALKVLVDSGDGSSPNADNIRSFIAKIQTLITINEQKKAALTQ